MAAGPGHVADSAASTTIQVEPLEDAQGCMHLVGLTELEVGGAAELLDLVRKAEQLRATGATSANETSSRSHAILQARCAPARTRRRQASP